MNKEEQKDLSAEVLDLTAMEGLEGGKIDGGCHITNGKCKGDDSGCGICNGKCNLEHEDVSTRES